MPASAAGRPDRPLRILHIGSGFRPWRRGGLVAYVEDLMGEQVRRGHEVSYLLAGRLYPVPGGPRLRRWERDGIAMLEIVNSPLYDHGRQPELEISEPRVERIVERAIADIRPDVVHVQELAGLPTSVLDIARAGGAPVLLTLQDYYPLCPMFKLYDAGGNVCLRREVGADCAANAAAEPRDPALLFESTILHHLDSRAPLRLLRASRRAAIGQRAARTLARPVSWRLRTRAAAGSGDRVAAFQRRRDVNVERLNRVDRLIAMSSRVAEIYALLGVEAGRLRTLQLTLSHIERLRPREYRGGGPVTFASLGAGESVAKGARVLLAAVRELSQEAGDGRFRLLLHGWVDPEFAAEARATPGVELRGMYAPARLDAILDEVDVGIMPSIWEEAYGYAGVEFLAKGCPVIANAIGGMVDYTRDGETGWLNRSCSAEGLAEIMRDVIERPEQIAELNARLRAEHDSIVMPLARHADQIEALYDEAIAERLSEAARAASPA